MGHGGAAGVVCETWYVANKVGRCSAKPMHNKAAAAQTSPRLNGIARRNAKAANVAKKPAPSVRIMPRYKVCCAALNSCHEVCMTSAWKGKNSSPNTNMSPRIRHAAALNAKQSPASFRAPVILPKALVRTYLIEAVWQKMLEFPPLSLRAPRPKANGLGSDGL